MQYLVANIAADFGVKLGSVKIIAVQNGTERNDVVCCCDGMCANWGVIGVVVIHECLVLYALCERRCCTKKGVPARVRYFEGQVFREPQHGGVKNTHAISVVFLGVAAHELHPHASTQYGLREGWDEGI